jgi:hypothetical protein
MVKAKILRPKFQISEAYSYFLQLRKIWPYHPLSSPSTTSFRFDLQVALGLHEDEEGAII